MNDEMFPVEARTDLSALYTSYKGMAFVSPYLSASQTALEMIIKMNDYVQNDPYHEVCLYSGSKDSPILMPNSAVFNSLDIRDHEGPLIAIDPHSWIIATTFHTGQNYYYIYDPLLLKYIPKSDLDRMVKSDTVFFTRSDAHGKFLKKNFNLDTIKVRVPNFDMDIIKEIVNG